MNFRKKVITTAIAALAAGCALGSGPVLAGELFEGLGPVAGQDLEAQRGMAFEIDEEALAKAVGFQHQNVTINGVEAGDAAVINFGTHTFDGQVMSLNIINSGHNNVFQAQNVIAVTVVDSNINP